MAQSTPTTSLTDSPRTFARRPARALATPRDFPGRPRIRPPAHSPAQVPTDGCSIRGEGLPKMALLCLLDSSNAAERVHCPSPGSEGDSCTSRGNYQRSVNAGQRFKSSLRPSPPRPRISSLLFLYKAHSCRGPPGKGQSAIDAMCSTEAGTVIRKAPCVLTVVVCEGMVECAS